MNLISTGVNLICAESLLYEKAQRPFLGQDK